MELQRHHIVGRPIAGIWESFVHDQTYADHYVSLESGLLINFSWGKLTAVARPPPTLLPANPWRATGAPRAGDGWEAPSCIGQSVVDVVYSRVKWATGETEREGTYILLADGRYLTSEMGFNYTALDADFFARWNRHNQLRQTFRTHWGDEPFKPFGPV